jgi:cell division protease FtsH
MGAAGYTMPLPEKDEMFSTKGRMLQDIIVGLGGRVAEEMIFDDITTGASQDIKECTDTARKMVIKYGFSENIGLINYESDSDEVFLGRDLGHARSYGEEIAGSIDKEVKAIIDECHTKAKKLMEEHVQVLHQCAAYLIEHEKMGRSEFEALFTAENGYFDV